MPCNWRKFVKRRTTGRLLKGLKIGLTSKAMQEMLNVYTPDYGFILDTMVYDEADGLRTESFIQPKVEFEIAFVFNKELKGPDVTVQDVIDATAYVVPAVEVIDSRIAELGNKVRGYSGGQWLFGRCHFRRKADPA